MKVHASPAKRKVVAANFGRQLTRLRGDQSRADVVAALRRFGLTVDRSTLLQYEHGCISAPDPAVLWALGRHYGLESIDDLIATLVMDRTGRPLRSGVDIAASPYTIDQRHIAESFGALPKSLQAAINIVFAGLGDVSATDRVAHKVRA